MNATALPRLTDAGGAGVTVSLRELVALRALAMPGSPSYRKTAHAAAPGSHASGHRGRGMEFAEARIYQSGDDVRAIDWRQSARRGHLYTKLFQEEQERTIRLLVDLGPEMRFGTRGAFKSVVAARVAAMLAWMAAGAGDRVGGVVWDGGVQREIRPCGRHRGALALLRGLVEVAAAPPGRGGDMSLPLQSLLRSRRPGSLTVVISDFTALDAAAETRLGMLAQCTELVLVHVHDIFESQPPPGMHRVSDSVRTLDIDLRDACVPAFAARRDTLERLARRSGAILLPVATHMRLEAELPRLLPQLLGYRAPIAHALS